MIMAGRAEDGPTRGREACRGPREERSGRARNLMMEWFYFIVRLRPASRDGRSDRPTPPIPAKLKQNCQKNVCQKKLRGYTHILKVIIAIALHCSILIERQRNMSSRYVIQGTDSRRRRCKSSGRSSGTPMLIESCGSLNFVVLDDITSMHKLGTFIKSVTRPVANTLIRLSQLFNVVTHEDLKRRVRARSWRGCGKEGVEEDNNFLDDVVKLRAAV